MKIKLSLLCLAASVSAQVDDFKCPDEFAGFFPHLISCDKYWSCNEGIAELRTCGNGLGFLDTDDTFTLEQCEELHLVECGDRTEIEPPISTEHCPRLFGTFADELDCGVFWKCQDGKPNKYNCPPGLAYDQVSRGCRWADQVPECSGNKVVIDEEGGEFQCPTVSSPGIFTKHAHPADCRQYFLCIGGIPREYGCPLGTVFDVGTGSGEDGKCSDPEDVPECASYYGDVDLGDIARSGADTGAINREGRPRTGGSSRKVNRIQNTIRDSVSRDSDREKARPVPASLQNIVDTDSRDDTRSRPRPSRLEISRPQSQSSRTRGPFRPSENEIEETIPFTPSPNRLQEIPIETTKRPSPARLQVLTDRPNTRTTFPRRQEERTTEQTTTVKKTSTSNNRFSTAGRLPFSPSVTTTTEAPSSFVGSNGLPAPAPAAPGPNGEEYYYYYYYYDDEEAAAAGKGGKALDDTPGS